MEIENCVINTKDKQQPSSIIGNEEITAIITMRGESGDNIQNLSLLEHKKPVLIQRVIAIENLWFVFSISFPVSLFFSH